MVIIIVLSVLAGFQQSCKKKETTEEQVYLTVDIPKSVLQNDLYYPVSYDARFIELEFSQAIDTSTIRGNLSFSDNSGPLDTAISIMAVDRKIVLLFNPSFQLQEGLRSVSGLTFPSETVLEIRTPALTLTEGIDTTQRNAILCISDIHLGEYRAVTGNYCWFSKNEAALYDLLDFVLTTNQVRELVILGDLFDEWVIPYRFSPFDTVSGITDTRGYFLSVASSPVNLPVVSKLKEIASSGNIRLIYIPGNHDMLLTQGVLEEIIPGVIWQGNIPGLGEYSPVSEIIMEHGHMLPPGFFVSRMQAEGLRENPGSRLKEASAGTGSLEFNLAWDLALTYLEVQYHLTVHEDSVNIQMAGIDGYANPFSYNAAKAMYAANIETNWNSTQQQNGVPLNMPVIMAILDGNDDLFTAASYEYMSVVSPKIYKMTVFGHTHNPELKVFPTGKHYTGIYANSGSWVNAELTEKKVRTCLMIWPGQWTGSDLDIVSLYQYNLDSGNGNPDPDYIPVLLAEESIERGN
jgi:UDP-2,3-diacylglucosamine pyrophosphatase LpxH